MGIQLASAVLYNNGHVQLYNVQLYNGHVQLYKVQLYNGHVQMYNVQLCNGHLQLYNGHVSFRVSEGRLVAFAFESGRINRVGQNCTLHIKRRITYDKAH
jgi:hypothetical protein